MAGELVATGGTSKLGGQFRLGKRERPLSDCAGISRRVVFRHKLQNFGAIRKGLYKGSAFGGIYEIFCWNGISHSGTDRLWMSGGCAMLRIMVGRRFRSKIGMNGEGLFAECAKVAFESSLRFGGFFHEFINETAKSRAIQSPKLMTDCSKMSFQWDGTSNFGLAPFFQSDQMARNCARKRSNFLEENGLFKLEKGCKTYFLGSQRRWSNLA
uniref:Uncharacterized protein n=1 Tax=Globodera rostochiensis TaxID=31243 RepID=A0A914I1W0_GLORO